jgi:hypothetical protein
MLLEMITKLKSSLMFLAVVFIYLTNCSNLYAITISTNEYHAFDVPYEKSCQTGFSEGLVTKKPEVVYNQPIKLISFKNISKTPINIDAIFLNDTGMMFNHTALKYKYDINGAINLDQAKRLFWDNYRLAHHAQPHICWEGGITDIWNLFGYGLCGWQNIALNTFFEENKAPARRMPAFGHAVCEYLIDGKWRIFDFDQKAYYLTCNGEVASHNDVFNDPYLIFGQSTYGPCASKKNKYRAAIILQNKQTTEKPSLAKRAYRRLRSGIRKLKYTILEKICHKYCKQKGINKLNDHKYISQKQRLSLESGDEVTFTDHQASNVITNYTNYMWQRPNMFMKTGYYKLAKVPEVREKYCIKKQLPFFVDEINFEFVVHGDSLVEAVLVSNDKKTPLFIIRKPGPVKIIKKLTHPSKEIEIRLYINKAAKEKSYIDNIEITFQFFYNSRALFSVEPHNKLFIAADQNEKLDFQIQFNADYKNIYFDAQEPCDFDYQNGLISIDIQPKKAVYYEYYLSQNGNPYPVSPTHYFFDSDGKRHISDEFLPSGAYTLHYRCQYKDGYWSRWKTASSKVRVNNIFENVNLAFYQEGGRLHAKLKNFQANHNYTLIISRNKFFPIKKGEPFFKESDYPIGSELSNEKNEEYTKLHIDENSTVLFPRCGSFYRIISKGKAVSQLYKTIEELKKTGIRTPDSWILPGKGFKIQWEVIDWPLEYYRWVETTEGT